jgi:hypothetical protein
VVSTGSASPPLEQPATSITAHAAAATMRLCRHRDIDAA